MVLQDTIERLKLCYLSRHEGPYGHSYGRTDRHRKSKATPILIFFYSPTPSPSLSLISPRRHACVCGTFLLISWRCLPFCSLPRARHRSRCCLQRLSELARALTDRTTQTKTNFFSQVPPPFFLSLSLSISIFRPSLKKTKRFNIISEIQTSW